MVPQKFRTWYSMLMMSVQSNFVNTVCPLSVIIQLFHVCLGNSQNYRPEVPWTSRCTIIRGRYPFRGAVGLSIPPNGHKMLKIPVFSPRNASFIGTRCRYTQFTSLRSTSFSWCFLCHQPGNRQNYCPLLIHYLNGWRHRCGIVNSIAWLMTSYERCYMYVAAAHVN